MYGNRYKVVFEATHPLFGSSRNALLSLRDDKIKTAANETICIKGGLVFRPENEGRVNVDTQNPFKGARREYFFIY